MVTESEVAGAPNPREANQDSSYVRLALLDGSPTVIDSNNNPVKGTAYEEAGILKFSQPTGSGEMLYSLDPAGKGSYRMRPEGYRKVDSPASRESYESSPVSRRQREPEGIGVEITSQSKDGKSITYEIRGPGGVMADEGNVVEGSDGRKYVYIEGNNYLRLGEDENGYRSEEVVTIRKPEFFPRAKVKVQPPKPKEYTTKYTPVEEKTYSEKETPVSNEAMPSASSNAEKETYSKKKAKANEKRELGEMEGIKLYLERGEGPFAQYTESLKDHSNIVTRPVEVTFEGELFVKNFEDPQDNTYTQLKAGRGVGDSMKYSAVSRNVIVNDPDFVFMPEHDAMKMLKGKDFLDILDPMVGGPGKHKRRVIKPRR